MDGDDAVLKRADLEDRAVDLRRRVDEARRSVQARRAEQLLGGDRAINVTVIAALVVAFLVGAESGWVIRPFSRLYFRQCRTLQVPADPPADVPAAAPD
jgi:hypothetical protein